MDVKLDDLINQIKSEGVEEAQKEAGKIVKDARKKANSIVKEAEEDAETIKQDAEKEAEKIKSNGESALKQAQRDTILTTKEKLTEMFDNVFKDLVNEKLETKVVANLIQKVVEQLGEDKEYEFTVNDKEVQKLRKAVFAKSKSKLKDTVTITADKNVSAGFKIGLKGEDIFYDLTDEGISEFLMTFLNPSIREILSK
ncbi:MAG: hypothetical protein K9M80_01735 [Candidatus Marinimicrobia bacterium]|nr:hypothetical protein [Candidatus Neomarinimicrobiota bacterium]